MREDTDKRSVVLVSKNHIEEKEAELRIFLASIENMNFWKFYAQDKHFALNPKEFTWDYWKNLPYSSKEDFIKMGLKGRLADVLAGLNEKRDIFNFILRSTSGTTGSVPVLFLNPVANSFDIFHRKKQEFSHILTLQKSFMMGLRSVLLNIARCQEKKAMAHTLVIDPFVSLSDIRPVLEEYRADLIVALPANLVRFMANLNKPHEIAKFVKRIKMNGDFLSKPQASILANIFSTSRGLKMGMDYAMTEFGRVGVWCQYLEERYKTNVYHPGKFFLVELVDLDEDGSGEIVVTKIIPKELAILRYKTGDIGKAIFEKCECGAGITLFLSGRKNFDYIKCAGVLIIRKEIERSISDLSADIKEWRGEVREYNIGKDIVGELTLKLKTETKMSEEKMGILNASLSDSIFLTPNATISELVRKQKFLHLKIEIVDGFPLTGKNVVLRKIS